eukprot:CAMPEP_0170089706 /NCGR_PEP_ID=MMETSP0019_2-20121128/23707_1 /TAXON_ID=98059 /ORGANISM="Dinobryon sp., Strain UTEXLB2267" /LENGTH=93 /DNA_ID=CAMNT_0010308671 /DNA_START=18 /DNA_END=299 /DNA_ORIENTATION=+
MARNGQLRTVSSVGVQCGEHHAGPDGGHVARGKGPPHLLGQLPVHGQLLHTQARATAPTPMHLSQVMEEGGVDGVAAVREVCPVPPQTEEDLY